ncbi:MAG: hypothetical protein MZV64_27915 [Ignavibacteriales bacterium]|nr:hypothetical protein [Ignavibacteriales bacterium]
MPFHMWAPDVYEGAPDVGDGLHDRGHQGGGVRRAAAHPDDRAPGAPAGLEPRALGRWRSLTMTVGNVAALAQTNIKRMLAY